MGLFGQSSPFDADIDKATSEKNTTEPWGVIMDICDKISTNPKNAKDVLKSILRRMSHNDPHVAIQAVTLLDACINNCGKQFHLEVASREFENEFKRILGKAHLQEPQLALKMRQVLKKWAENDFKNDPQLILIPSLYQILKSEGLDFSDTPKPSKSATPAAALKDPNVVTSQQEEEDIAKAIELSLKEVKSSPKKQPTSSSTYPSLYPSFTGGATLLSNPTTSASSVSPLPEPRKVRALYDFEAAEENELTFVAGEIIHVQDDSDPNWWKGYNQRGEGLFPSNFVTADLSVEPEKYDINQKSKKSVQFDDDSTKDDKTDNNKPQDEKVYVPEINEEKVDRLLYLLHEANPEDPSQDTEEMLQLEEEVNKMGPLIDAELERVDRKHAQLTQLSSDLVDAINLYHTLMREPERTNMGPHGPPLGPPMNFISTYNPQQNVYGPSPIYGMPNMFHQGVPSSMAQTSMPSMPMIQMMPGPQPGSHQQVHPSQLPPIVGNTGQGGFNTLPSQMVPMQFQNGHPPPQMLHMPQQAPQQQSQSQESQQPPQQPIHQHPIQHAQPSTIQPPISSSQAQQQQTQNQRQQLPPPGSQPNQNFLPPNPMPTFPNQPGNFPSHLQSLPLPGALHVPQQVPQMIHNGSLGGNLMGQPQSIGIPNHNPGLLSHQMAAINQPVTHTILGQNESKANIPIYQQQR